LLTAAGLPIAVVFQVLLLRQLDRGHQVKAVMPDAVPIT
jgi:hypothetical protein